MYLHPIYKYVLICVHIGSVWVFIQYECSFNMGDHSVLVFIPLGVHSVWAFIPYGFIRYRCSFFMDVHAIWVFIRYGCSFFMGVHSLWVSVSINGKYSSGFHAADINNTWIQIGLSLASSVVQLCQSFMEGHLAETTKSAFYCQIPKLTWIGWLQSMTTFPVRSL